MKESPPPQPLSPEHRSAEELIRDRRRRRWVIRLGLGLLLLVLALSAAFVLLIPHGMSAEEAEAAFAQLKAGDSRERALLLLGKPYTEETAHGLTTCYWLFYTHSILQTDVLHCTMMWDQHGRVHQSSSTKVKLEGWETWRWRWNKVMQRVGIR